jgi:hypothetical protein
MKKASCTILLMLAISQAQATETQRRFYDARGNSLGASSKDNQGTTTFRDARGRVIGKETK